MLDLIVLGALVMGGGALIEHRRRRKRRAAQLAEDRAALEVQVDALASHITGLADEIDVAPGPRAELARPSYDQALAAYTAATEGLPEAKDFPAVERLGTTLADGVHAARTARALLDGAPEPARDGLLTLGLCAFDPAHGRAVQRVEVTTPSGTESLLPVCGDCEQGLRGGQVPAPRITRRGGIDTVYWHDPRLPLPLEGGIGGLMAVLDDLVRDGHVGVRGAGRGAVNVRRSTWVYENGRLVHESHEDGAD